MTQFRSRASGVWRWLLEVLGFIKAECGESRSIVQWTGNRRAVRRLCLMKEQFEASWSLPVSLLVIGIYTYCDGSLGRAAILW